jgi:dipeptidase
MMRRLSEVVACVAVVCAMCIPQAADACTNILVTKGATKDGSTFISYAADSHTLYGELYFRPAATYTAGTMRDVTDWDAGTFRGRIPQALQTYAVVGNMNEYQVAIGETTFGGRAELADSAGIVDYGSLMYIALERSRTAREAIHVMTSLVAQFGYGSEGESFSISDPREVWIMEMIGKGPGKTGALWVARKIPDGFVSGHANHARITTFPLKDTLTCLYAPDVITVARERGWFTGNDEDFSFSDVYAPLDFEAARFCEARVWAVFNRVAAGMDQYLNYVRGADLAHRMPLWIKPDRKLDVHDVMELMRDYFQGTEFDMSKDAGAGPFGCPYRWRPLTWAVDSAQYLNERAIATQQTGFSFVAQGRSWLPDHIGGILWFGVDDIFHSVYTPMYCSMTSVPPAFAVGNGSMMEFSDSSAFWVFNQVSNLSYTRFDLISPEIRARQADLEGKYLALVPAIDKAALELTKAGKGTAVQFLTDFSVTQGQATFAAWKSLYRELFVKFMDGNVKTKVAGQMNPKVVQPGYSVEWKRRVAQDAGAKLHVPAGKSH